MDEERSPLKGHEAEDFVTKFVQMRSTHPSGGLLIKSLLDAEGQYRKFEIGGQKRGVTLWVPSLDACWLMAFNSKHRTGAPDDSYAVFENLFERGDLELEVDDVAKLRELSPKALLDELEEIGPALLAEAISNPQVEAMRTLETIDGDAIIYIDMVVGPMSAGCVGITLPEGFPWPKDVVWAIASALLTEDVTHVEWANDVHGRPLRRGELAFTFEL
jgi:hypothetical protein